MEFEKRKAMAMEAMKDPEPDKSPKGTLDLPIVPLLQFINGNPSFFTTSSCSGRISIFSHAPSPQIDSTVAFDDVSTVEFKKKSKKKKAGGGRWILVSHGLVEAESVVNLLFGSGSGKGSAGEGDLVFRFEPFILAVECRDATSAQFLVSTAIASGFRESGITSLGRRIIIAIRCSIRLEVPLGSNGEIMVSPEYIRYLVEIANDKMRENKKKTDAFYRALSCQTIVSSVETSNTSLGRSNNISGEPKAIKPSADKDFQLPMSVERITIKGEPLEKLFLWGQSACALKGNHRDEIIVFGGFGGIGRHARRNEALMMDPSSGFLRLIRAEGHPSPRLGHTLSAVGKWVFVIGGRGDPTQIFNDVWAFDMEESRWMLMSCSGNILPGRWDRLGDMVVIPVNSFKDSAWESISEELWPIVARSLGAHRLARQGRVLPTGTRDSSLEILVGDNGLVEHTENGIIYSFDATKCMFSLGNLSEKLRMAKLDCRDEVVVDLFAGIGYFVLQFLVRAKARLVYACEWNPHALAALRRILEINMVADRCIVIEGDNRLSAPKGVADRVCLGLIPSSECSWLTAVRALRPEGGVLHIHGNVNDSEETVWAEFVVKSVDRMAKEEGYSWDVSLQHLEHVKSYAPHVHHLVADVRCHRP
ncbi:met-10+ like family protein / kelch repeat-containing protein isoform X2 [Wolffia australiana]